jgi:polyhydroxyalkanoate synthesis regulator phasin
VEEQGKKNVKQHKELDTVHDQVSEILTPQIKQQKKKLQDVNKTVDELQKQVNQLQFQWWPLLHADFEKLKEQ